MRRLFAIVLIVTGCGVGSHKITGTFKLIDSDVNYNQFTCYGLGGYADIREGADVIVKDGSGKIIAKSKLVDDKAGSSARGCAYTFEVADVPSADFYAVSVGRRGELTYSKSEMAAQGWKVSFSLGGS